MNPKSVPIKPVKMWAVIDSRGRVSGVSQSKAHASDFALDEIGDTVRPVLVTEIKPNRAKKGKKQ